jgi:hypothetical protein
MHSIAVMRQEPSSRQLQVCLGGLSCFGSDSGDSNYHDKYDDVARGPGTHLETSLRFHLVLVQVRWVAARPTHSGDCRVKGKANM